jgi:hypothetical protein
MAAVASLVGIAAPAQADGGWAATVQPYVVCQPGSIRIDPFVSVQDGYYNGQYLSYRYHLNSNITWSVTSGWSGSVLVPFKTTSWGATTEYGLSKLPAAEITARRGVVWYVYVQVGYWNPNTRVYTYSQWTPPYKINQTNFQRCET